MQGWAWTMMRRGKCRGGIGGRKSIGLEARDLGSESNPRAWVWECVHLEIYIIHLITACLICSFVFILQTWFGLYVVMTVVFIMEIVIWKHLHFISPSSYTRWHYRQGKSICQKKTWTLSANFGELEKLQSSPRGVVSTSSARWGKAASVGHLNRITSFCVVAFKVFFFFPVTNCKTS